MNYLTFIACLQFLTIDIPTQEELRQIIGLSQSAMSNRANRNSKFKKDEIEKLNAHFNIDLMAVKKEYAKQHKKDELKQQIKPASIVIDYYPDVFGSCGNGNFVFSETTDLIDVPVNSIACYSAHKQYSVINASGDSMTPYIQHADKLVVEHWRGEQIVDNNIYVFRYIDNIFIKRLVQNVDQIIIKSDNKEYEPRYIDYENFENMQIIGKIVGLLREVC